MAMRRQLRDTDEPGEYGSAFYDDGGAIQGFGSDQPQSQSPFGSDFREDTDGSLRPPGFFDLSPEEQQQIRDIQSGAIAGNTDTARELFGRTAPTDRPTGGLPQGMTVQGEEGGSDMFGGTESMSTPPQNFSPSPQANHPAVTQRVSMGGAPSALFGDSSSGTPLFGRLGGLTGGGKGVFGSETGAPTPTQMMLRLVKMFQNGGY